MAPWVHMPAQRLLREMDAARPAKILKQFRKFRSAYLCTRTRICVMCCRPRATHVISLICVYPAGLIRPEGKGIIPEVIGNKLRDESL